MRIVLLGVALFSACTSEVVPLSAPVVAVHDPITLSLGGWDVVPGLTPSWCIVVRLPNERPAFLTAVHSHLGPAGHHVTLLTTDETTERLEPFECQGFGDVLGVAAKPLTISQVPEDSLRLPPGTGFRLQAHQMVKVESHFLNTGRAPVIADASVTLEWSDVPPGAAPASQGFYGVTELAAPAGEWSGPWRFIPLPAGTRVFGVSAHTHSMGVNLEVERAMGPDVPGVRLYPGDEPGTSPTCGRRRWSSTWTRPPSSLRAKRSATAAPGTTPAATRSASATRCASSGPTKPRKTATTCA